jgi:hypothetical protein
MKMQDYEKKFYSSHPWVLTEREWYWKFVGGMFLLFILGFVVYLLYVKVAAM